MKQTFLKYLAFAAVAIGLMACGAGANAQVLPTMFKASNGEVFTINDVRSVEGVSGYVKIVFHNGNLSGTTFTDTSGAVFAAVKASGGFYDRFVQVGASQRWVNVQATRRVFCNFGSTTITWMEGGGEDFTGDGCALHSTIAARSL